VPAIGQWGWLDIVGGQRHAVKGSVNEIVIFL
jgi:hypothetical protein